MYFRFYRLTLSERSVSTDFIADFILDLIDKEEELQTKEFCC